MGVLSIRSALLFPLLALAIAVSAAPTVTYFQLAGVSGRIAAGPDGNLWIPTTEGIVKMTPSGETTTYPTPNPPAGTIVAGPDGRIWYMVSLPTRLGAITTAGVASEYPLDHGVHPYSLTAGPDGNLWFGYRWGVGRITPAGEATYYPILDTRGVPDIETGPDGNIWFVEYPDNRMGRITPAGEITRFSTYPQVCCGPASLARGADGQLWIAFNQGRAIARIVMDGTLELFHPTGADPASPGRPMSVHGGPEARIWFATEWGSHIGRIRPDGQVELIPLRPNIPMVFGMIGGPDGNLWATVDAPGVGCTLGCPPPDPTPPVGVVRVNLAASDHADVPTASEGALAMLAIALAALALKRFA
jgi:virginiamycin B lyase